MASLSFIPYSKTYFSIYMHHSRFLLKKSTSPCHNHIGICLSSSFLYSHDTATVSSFYASKARNTFSNQNLKFAAACLLKHRYALVSKMMFQAKQSSLTFKCSRSFRTTECRYFHPVLWAVFTPVIKFLAIIAGRAFRKWWQDLLPNKKKYFSGRIKENRKNIAFFVLASITLSLIYYVSHIEETPITKRRRFMAFNSGQLEQFSQFIYHMIMIIMESEVLPANDPYALRVKAVAKRILDANQDIKEIRLKKWDVVVIDSPIENAFVLPMGCVFVFTGMLSLCSNEDQLSTVLSHEIAHCILNHAAEGVSFGNLLDKISIVIIAAIWALIPSDTMSLLTHWLYDDFMDILLDLPCSRKLETEADTVGLQLAAKACFDVRESSALWAKMALNEDIPNTEFLSTHPSPEKRSKHLDSIMDEVINLRKECGCPKLKHYDPRSNIEVCAKTLKDARQRSSTSRVSNSSSAIA